MNPFKRFDDVVTNGLAVGICSPDDVKWFKACWEKFKSGESKDLNEAFDIPKSARRTAYLERRDYLLRRAYDLIDPEGKVTQPTKRGQLLAKFVEQVRPLWSEGKSPVPEDDELYQVLWEAFDVSGGRIPGERRLGRLLQEND